MNLSHLQPVGTTDLAAAVTAYVKIRFFYFNDRINEVLQATVTNHNQKCSCLLHVRHQVAALIQLKVLAATQCCICLLYTSDAADD